MFLEDLEKQGGGEVISKVHVQQTHYTLMTSLLRQNDVILT